jgi:hypothetical protein
MIKYLKYKEKDLPIRVSYYALKRVKEKRGKSLSTMAEDDFEAQELLLLYSLKKGCEEEGIKFEYHFREDEEKKMVVDIEFMDIKTTIENVMDEVFFDFMKIVPEFFPKKEGKETEDEKK